MTLNVLIGNGSWYPAVTPTNPVQITSVSVGLYSGSKTTVGSTLIPNPAVWQNEAVAGQYPIQRSWQWYRDGVAITNAVSGTYTTVQADSGTSISVRETAFFLSPSNNGITYEAPNNTTVSTSTAVAVTGNVAANLVFSNHIQYLGSFQLAPNPGWGTFGFGNALAINPSSSSGSGRSMICSAYDNNVNTNPVRYAEVIPPTSLGNGYTTPWQNLPTVTMAFPTTPGYNTFYDLYNNQLNSSGILEPKPSQPVYLTGTSKMIMGSFMLYPASNQPYSIWWRRDALLSSTTMDGRFTISDPNATGTVPRWTVGYAFPIPPEHQAALGNKQYIGGTYAMSIITSQSDGPSGCAFSNADIDDAISKYTTGTAQGPGTGNNTIVLSASDTRGNDFYKGMLIYVPSATAFGALRKITGYVASTKTATVDINWIEGSNGALPTSSSTYAIYPNANGKQLFGYLVDQMQALSTDGAASQSRGVSTVRKWDGACLGGCFPNGTKSVLIFGFNGDGYWTYGIPGQVAASGPLKVYSPGGYFQNAPMSYPCYAKVYAYNVDDLALVQNGTLAFNQVKPYGVWDFPIPRFTPPTLPYSMVGSTIVYDPATKRMYLTVGFYVHVYEITNAVIV